MSTFNDRERAFESKFAHDQDMQFRANARRNKKLGLWAAEKLGKTGEEAEAYAMEVVRVDFHKPGQDDVVNKLGTDLGDRVDEAEIRRRMDQLLTEAKAELAEEPRKE